MMNRPNFAGKRSRKLGKSWTADSGGGKVSAGRWQGGGRVEARVDSRVVGSDS